MVYLHLRVSDHADIQKLWSASQDLSNDVSNLVKFQKFIFSTCLRFRVWEGIISPESARSMWYSLSVISKSNLSNAVSYVRLSQVFIIFT